MEVSKAESENEAGKMIDIMQTLELKQAEVIQPIIKEKLEPPMKRVESEEVLGQV